MEKFFARRYIGKPVIMKTSDTVVSSVNVKRPCKDLSLLMSMKHRGRPQVDPSKLSASGARARKKTRKDNYLMSMFEPYGSKLRSINNAHNLTNTEFHSKMADIYQHYDKIVSIVQKGEKNQSQRLESFESIINELRKYVDSSSRTGGRSRKLNASQEDINKRERDARNKAKRLFVQAIQSVVKQHWTELSPELQEECVFIIKPNAIAENSPSGHLTLRNPFGPIDEMANEMYLANERLNAAPSIQRPLLDEEDRNLTESFSGLPPGQAEVYDDSISASQQDVLQRDVSSDNDQDLDLLRNYLEENISYSEFMQNMFPESTSDTLLQMTATFTADSISQTGSPTIPQEN
ncbi:hypothetical protein QR680_012299 [Steinernema hermaphroditum]|uniref:Uncharacterized protein n=1 Tax=Steinernema hermaphroditum TaxID=289476 RepID=A0AA39I1K5_9BILA|nr:hypothetical protein QR680_012299 [Steinernema hermaphroditum]